MHYRYFSYISISMIILLSILYVTNLKAVVGNLIYDSSSGKVCPNLNLIEEYSLMKEKNVDCICSINSNSSFESNCPFCINSECSYEGFKSGTESEDIQFRILNSGGWITRGEERIIKPGKCNIEKISGKLLTPSEFLKLYAYEKPVVIVNATDNKEFQELTTYQNLIRYYGHTEVKLSSANSYSYDNTVKTFKEYCQTNLKGQSLTTLANETFYFFGDNNNEDWYDLLYEYKLPPYSLPGHLAQLSFGVAGPGSGVPFHFHGPGFAETLWGRKRWFMYPPSSTPHFDPNRTTLQWVHGEYLDLKEDPELMECTLSPGELIYFPDHWWHATLNIDTTVFMSTFLSP